MHDTDFLHEHDALTDADRAEIARAQRRWEESLAAGADWASSRRLAVHLPLAGDLSGVVRPDPAREDKYLYLIENSPQSDSGPAPKIIEPVWKDGSPEYASGRRAPTAVFDGKRYIDLGAVAGEKVRRFYPGFGMGGMGGQALNQLLVVMDGIDEPPMLRKFITNRTNSFLDAVFVVPRKLGPIKLRLLEAAADSQASPDVAEAVRSVLTKNAARHPEVLEVCTAIIAAPPTSSTRPLPASAPAFR